MRIEHNFNLTNYNSYRIMATCEKVYFPESNDDFLEIFSHGDLNDKIILGGGYNVILSKPHYNKEFIIIGDSFSKITMLSANTFRVQSGMNMKTLSTWAQKKGLSGLEMFYDIPSSLGGAVVMNAGASGEEIKDVLFEVEYLDLEGMKINHICRKDIGFRYRNSVFQGSHNKIILSATLALNPESKQVIQEKMIRIQQARWAKQPKDYPNAGSVFKRPEGYYVGTMVESLGLKGLTVGGAQVSKKHAGFIVNFNNAKGEDILKLIEIIKEKVFENYGVHLEVEQRII